MRGVVLAGGGGSRLAPLTDVTNKHLLPVGGVPMIEHPVRKLVGAGIREILVVTGTEHAGAVFAYLGSGSRFGCEFTFRVQDEAGGIAQALSLARGFCYGDRLCVVLGDNVFEDDLISYVARYARQDRGAMVLLKEVDDPSRYGVAALEPVDPDPESACHLGGEWRISSIEEKPEEPKSPYAVTGIYFYDYRVFDVVRSLKPSGRGELEITDVNNAYLEWGELKCAFMEGWWTDAGTHGSLARANELARRTT
jgi:glucose-1-phosphate thymidylyltransferase